MPSLRRRLNLRIVVGSSLLLGIVGLYANARIASEMQQEFDRGLKGETRALVTLTQEHDGEVELDFADEYMPQFSRAEEPEYFQVWLGDEVLERSRSLRGASLPRMEGIADTFRLQDLELPDGSPGRMAQLDFVPQRTDDSHPDAETAIPASAAAAAGRTVATVALARRRTGLDGSLQDMSRLLLAGGVLLVLGMATMVSSVTASGLAPIAEIGRQVQEMGAHSLQERVRVPHAPEEIAPLIAKINDLLGNLDRAMTRERQLSADIAHELRTPLAELRNLAEVGHRWPDNRAAVERFFQDVLAISGEMEGTIEDLLSLASCEAGLEELHVETVPLADVVQGSWSLVAARGQAKEISLQIEVDERLAVSTDRAKLRRIVDNLLANAVEYGAPGSPLRCILGPGPTLAVRNAAPDLEPADVAHLFERFWRKDPARSGRPHAGVGLALCQAVARTLSATLVATLDADGWLEMRLTFPVS